MGMRGEMLRADGRRMIEVVKKREREGLKAKGFMGDILCGCQVKGGSEYTTTNYISTKISILPVYNRG